VQGQRGSDAQTSSGRPTGLHETSPNAGVLGYRPASAHLITGVLLYDPESPLLPAACPDKQYQFQSAFDIDGKSPDIISTFNKN
jgi:hypothetical protein